MRGNHNGDKKKESVGVELKYCEHCGGLWVRERGSGLVYCEKCQPKVADLPIPKRRRKVTLPVGPESLVSRYRRQDDEEESMPDLKAVGGVA